MESSNNCGDKQQASGASTGGKPARTHWRHRDPSATAVYVIHPSQFRNVVQQLTGAPAPPATATRSHDSGNGAGAGTATAAAFNIAADQQQREGVASKGEESSSWQRTLGQMHQECMAWANSDEYDY